MQADRHNPNLGSKKTKNLFLNSVDSEEIWKLIEQLPLAQKLAIEKKLLGKNSEITLVFNGTGSNNVIENSVVIQTSQSKELADQITEQITTASPEILNDLLIAIAEQIKVNAEQEN